YLLVTDFANPRHPLFGKIQIYADREKQFSRLTSVTSAARRHSVSVIVYVEIVWQSPNLKSPLPFDWIFAKAPRNYVLDLKVVESERLAAISAYSVVRQEKGVSIGNALIVNGHSSLAWN
ncbi:MAG: hypothetical protein ACRD5Z_04405, partial [Bryobacteraceae bacterium]